MKKVKDNKLTGKQFSLFVVNHIVGFGFIATISGVINLGQYGLIVIVLTSLITLGVALCFSRLAAKFPGSYGGSYHYAKQAYGRKAAFFVGWNQFIQGPILDATAPLFLASALTIVDVVRENPQAVIGIRVGSVLFFIALVFISTIGIRVSKHLIFLSALVKWLVLALGIVIALILSIREGAYTTNFTSANRVSSLMIFSNVISFMFAFGGMEGVAAISSDVKTKNFRKILMFAFAFILTLYFVVYIILNGLKIAPEIKNFSQIYQGLIGLTGVIIFVVGLVFNNISSRLTSSIIGARTIAPLAEDGLLPRALGMKSKKGELRNAILFAGGLTIISLIIFFVIPLELHLESFFNDVIQLGTIAFLVQYFFTMMSALVLEKTKKIEHIPFLEKVVYIVSMVLIAISLLIFLFPPITNEPWQVQKTIIIVAYIGFMAIGYLLYLIRYARKKRRNHHKQIY
ncbi:APC family permease [[Mycoplasma] testudinis]|uniref:APC family permease n=1 Tax=[Mycoplasma] testudinis TaxID=33924 RepID=UPI00048025EA|nr:APC family permease [[Mycoplasma] testudinis]